MLYHHFHRVCGVCVCVCVCVCVRVWRGDGKSPSEREVREGRSGGGPFCSIDNSVHSLGVG